MFCTVPRAIELDISSIDIGTIYTITESGSWECPASGNWQVEIHGGGGGAATLMNSIYASGGGSGEMYIQEFKRGQIISSVIGIGGSKVSGYNGDTGGTTTFGDLSIAGGGGGDTNLTKGGAASGSIATAGATGKNAAGGYGNKNNTAQTYGNGGSCVNGGTYDGSPGAVILTYLGT